MVQEAVEDGCRRGNIADQFAPLFQRPIRRHHGRLQLIPPHDHLEKVFAGTFRQRLDAHIVDNQQVRLEVFVHDFILPGEGFVSQEVPNHIEDGPVFYGMSVLDRLVAEGLREMTFPHTGWAQQQDILALMNEPAGGEIIHCFSWHGRIERKIESVDRLAFPEHCLLNPTLDHALMANLYLVLQDQLQELRMVQPMPGGFL